MGLRTRHTLAVEKVRRNCSVRTRVLIRVLIRLLLVHLDRLLHDSLLLVPFLVKELRANPTHLLRVLGAFVHGTSLALPKPFTEVIPHSIALLPKLHVLILRH